MRRGLGVIYQRFLNSQILLARVEKNQRRMKVFELLAKCQAPLEERTKKEQEMCGPIVTSEIDEEGFIAKGLFTTNLAISGPSSDIAFFSNEQKVFEAFVQWEDYAKRKRKKNAEEIARAIASNPGEY